MINKVLAWIAKKTYGNKILGWLDSANKSMSGRRSEILLGVLALLYVLEKVGVLPEGAFESVKPFLVGALPVTMAEKVKSAMSQADRVIPKKK